MTAEEIKAIINLELKSEKNLKDVFGLDITKCLIEPIKQDYKDSNDSSETYQLWTVLEESEDGYRIFFDEDDGLFGLAMKSDSDALINIGYHGSFLKTLYSM